MLHILLLRHLRMHLALLLILILLLLLRIVLWCLRLSGALWCALHLLRIVLLLLLGSLLRHVWCSLSRCRLGGVRLLLLLETSLRLRR